jgi:hypothetical protein
MKLKETVIKVQTEPKSMRLDDFAIECRRTRAQIDRAVSDGRLNWGKANGIMSIVQDDIADAFVKKCRASDELERELEKAK